jgi:hypothetical protein
LDEKDRFIQNAKTYSKIECVVGNIVTWKNVVETIPLNIIEGDPQKVRFSFLRLVLPSQKSFRAF